MGQTLVILSGKGLIQTDGELIVELQAGDVVWCPPNERHWEGASPDQAMRYFAFQEEDGAIVSFEEAVSYEEYCAAVEGLPIGKHG